MGTELSADDSTTVTTKSAHQDSDGSHLLQRIPWLDNGTASLLTAISVDLANAHPEVMALILFGSVARHEERPISHRRPSDVDLLVLVDASSSSDPLSLGTMIALHHAIGEREYLHPVPALSIQATLATSDLAGWDDLFITSVARDGVLLWSRGPLPQALAPVAARGAVFDPNQTVHNASIRR